MSWPALIPALALLAGVVCGCALLSGAPTAPLVVMLAAAFACSAAGFATRRDRIFLAGNVLTFVLAGWLLGVDASREALRPPLLALFESGAMGAAGHIPADGEPVGPVVIEGQLREDAAPNAATHTLSLSVESVTAGRAVRRTRGGVLLTVYGSLAAGRAGEWRAGRRVRATAQLRRPTAFRDPGVPDNQVALARRGTILVGSVKSGALVEVTARGTALAEIAASCRGLVRRAVAQAVGSWNERSAAIVTAILIGDRAGLDDEVRQRLQQAGTYHVIAISGGNIAILAGLSLFLLHLAGVRARAACLMTALALVSYAGLVGGGASVTRATLMGVTYLLARVGDHQGAASNALAVSVAVILAVAPLSVFDPAFALTVGATLGILAGAAQLGPRLPGGAWLRAPAALGLASLSAELALFPVAAYVFSRVTFAGLALNFVAIPLMTVAQVAGMAILPMWALSARAARAIGCAAHLGAFGLVESARLVDAAPWLTFRLPPPGISVMAAYYLAWIVWLRARAGGYTTSREQRARTVVRRSAVVCLAASGLWILVSPGSLVAGRSDGRLLVTFLDVGQADAILVRFPDARSLLLDTGGFVGGSTFDVGSRIVAPALWALGVRRLDYLAISHADPDHAGGALAVVRDFAPREIWEGIPVPPDPLRQALRLAADRARIPWRTLRSGDVMSIGGVDLRIWHPPPPDWERQKVRNDDSLVCELRLGQVSVLLPGDIGRDIEQGLVPRVLPAGLRVLKVAHHGSVSSSARGFVVAMQPDVAVLTIGGGTRISGDVLDTYHDAGAQLFRTDQDGAVSVETDGSRVVVRGFTGRTLSLPLPRS